MGQPALIIDETICEHAEALASQGLTKQQIALALGIGESTLYEKQAKFPEFKDAIKRGQAKGIAKVANALFERAVGFTTEEEKAFCHAGRIVTQRVIKIYPPDTTAAIFYLKNRAPEDWKDRLPDAPPGNDKPLPQKVSVEIIDGRKANMNT
jgi:hypothetical protein